MITVTDAIKASVTMRDVAERYGLKTNRLNKAICPFHQDTKPSLHIYGGKRGWFCFVCNEGGDVIDFVQKFFNLSFKDAIAKINDDFNLHLPIETEMDESQRIEAEKLILQKKAEQRRHEMKMKQLFTTYHAAFDRWKMLDDIKREQAPKTPLDAVSQEYVYACCHIDEAWEAVVEAEKMIRWEREPA